MTEVRLHTTVRRIKSGKTGRTPKPMGVYDPSVTYVCDDNVAPYVCVLRNGKDIRDGIDYYIMVRNYSWNGTNEGSTPAKDAAKPASDSTRVWKVFDNFGMVAAEIAMINYGLMAGSVCCQQGDARNGYDYALQYSQTGQDGTTEYEKFDPTQEPWADGQKWKPNLCLDWKKGKVYANDGTFSGTINADSGHIGGFKIDKGSLTNDSSTQKIDFKNDSFRVTIGGESNGVYIGRSSILGWWGLYCDANAQFNKGVTIDGPLNVRQGSPQDAIDGIIELNSNLDGTVVTSSKLTITLPVTDYYANVTLYFMNTCNITVKSQFAAYGIYTNAAGNQDGSPTITTTCRIGQTLHFVAEKARWYVIKSN